MGKIIISLALTSYYHYILSRFFFSAEILRAAQASLIIYEADVICKLKYDLEQNILVKTNVYC